MLAALSLARKGYSVFLIGPPFHADDYEQLLL
ncbi:Uncharacterised protein [Candidatus Bartonella washoeensis]|nr:Uncharacterised protein [Bartonella washoeensis]